MIYGLVCKTSRILIERPLPMSAYYGTDETKRLQRKSDAHMPHIMETPGLWHQPLTLHIDRQMTLWAAISPKSAVRDGQ
mgnify:CR=1 FL=1